MYEWIKAFHVIFMVTWFAGLFYLPRLYVYHAMTENAASFELLQLQERRLFIIMTIGAILTLVFGLSLLMVGQGVLFKAGWFHAKLLFLIILIGYHYFCYRLMLAFRQNSNHYSSRWYRLFNEVPGVLLIVIVLLAILKPF